MSYKSWNDFFYRFNDNKKTSSSASGFMNDLDNFENEYRKKYGSWLDCHFLNLSKKYGQEKADEIIKKNVDALNREKLLAIEAERKQYEFHPVPDGEPVPF